MPQYSQTASYKLKSMCTPCLSSMHWYISCTTRTGVLAQETNYIYGKDNLSYHLHELNNLSTDPTPDTYKTMAKNSAVTHTKPKEASLCVLCNQCVSFHCHWKTGHMFFISLSHKLWFLQPLIHYQCGIQGNSSLWLISLCYGEHYSHHDFPLLNLRTNFSVSHVSMNSFQLQLHLKTNL